MTKVFIFVPGVGGSNLYYHADGFKAYLTIPFIRGKLDTTHANALMDIAQQFDANSIIYDSDVQVSIPLFGTFNLAPGYNKLTRFFMQKGWSVRTAANSWKGKPTDSKDYVYYEFPYDWRIDIKQHAQNLNQWVNSTVLNEFPNPDIYLAGHSTGGLVLRAYLSDKYLNSGALQPHPQIKKLILLATPNHGAPKAYRILKTGEGFLNDSLPILKSYPPNINQTAAGWPLVYELLPANQYEKYMAPNGGPYPAVVTYGGADEKSIAGSFIASQSTVQHDPQIAQKMALNNDNLVNNSLSFHDDLGRETFMPAGATYAFYSDGLSTFMGLSWRVNTNSSDTVFQNCGDGTVPGRSVYDLKGLADDNTAAPIDPYNSEVGDFDPSKHFVINLNDKKHTDIPVHDDVLAMLSTIVDLT